MQPASGCWAWRSAPCACAKGPGMPLMHGLMSGRGETSRRASPWLAKLDTILERVGGGRPDRSHCAGGEAGGRIDLNSNRIEVDEAKKVQENRRTDILGTPVFCEGVPVYPKKAQNISILLCNTKLISLRLQLINYILYCICLILHILLEMHTNARRNLKLFGYRN